MAKASKSKASTRPAGFDVEWRPINEVTAYENNARIIPQSAIEKVATSIDAFGWQQPIVVDAAGVIIIGHTRLLAAKHLHLEYVPVKAEAHLTAAQVRALRIADNRTNQESIWDNEKLIAELGLVGEDSLSHLTGFSEAELSAYTDEGRAGDDRGLDGLNGNDGDGGDDERTGAPGSFPEVGEKATKHTCPKCGTCFNDKGEVQVHVSGKRDASGAAPAKNAKPGSRRRKPAAQAIGDADDA